MLNWKESLLTYEKAFGKTAFKPTDLDPWPGLPGQRIAILNDLLFWIVAYMYKYVHIQI